MNKYLELLENLNELTDSQKRILLGLTTYLTENDLNELEEYYKSSNINVIDSLTLDNISIKNEKIKDILERFKSYVY